MSTDDVTGYWDDDSTESRSSENLESDENLPFLSGAAPGIGIVVVTHTDYGARLVKAVEYIIGRPQGKWKAISVDITHEVEIIVDSIREAIRAVDSGSGVLILTDMFGGTPTNISLTFLSEEEFTIEVVTGVNLPMLIKAFGSRMDSLPTLAKDVKTAGVNGIVVAGDLIRPKSKSG